MLDKTLTIVLAGDEGSQLYPLTQERAKPAVPFGGKYRLIDFSLANCLHSGMRRILVLTQYKSHSLQKHLRDGWSIFNPEVGEYITSVPPQMRTGDNWYQGTADAIRQNLYLLERSGAETVLILSADHIYRMDYAAMLAFHQQQQADLTIACMEIDINQASKFGILSADSEQRIQTYEEKPQQTQPLADKPQHALASMGIYIFSMELLMQALRDDQQQPGSSHDFGKDIIPLLLSNQRVMAYTFGGEQGRVTTDHYWQEVGTLDGYYAANMDLLEAEPLLDLYQQDWPIRSYQQQTPPARTIPGISGNEGIFINSIIGGGAVIAGGNVQHSILFPQTYVGDNAYVEDSILFEGVHVGAEARLKNCIVDKDVHIPAKETIGYKPEQDQERFTISEQGVVVVPKGYLF